MKWAAAVCVQRRPFCCVASVARVHRLETFMLCEPGAYAPGFMPAPAPQAKNQTFGKAGDGLSGCEG